MKNKIDVLGNPLSVGDHVIRSSKWKGLYVTRIIGFSPVMVKTMAGLEYPQDVLLITPDQADRFKKHLG